MFFSIYRKYACCLGPCSSPTSTLRARFPDMPYVHSQTKYFPKQNSFVNLFLSDPSYLYSFKHQSRSNIVSFMRFLNINDLFLTDNNNKNLLRASSIYFHAIIHCASHWKAINPGRITGLICCIARKWDGAPLLRRVYSLQNSLTGLLWNWVSKKRLKRQRETDLMK